MAPKPHARKDGKVEHAIRSLWQGTKGLIEFVGAIVLIVAIVGVVVILPAGGGAIILAELSGGSARPHCAYRTGNRSCPRPATTAKAIRTKAALDSAVKRFRDEYPGLVDWRSSGAKRPTASDVLEYRGNGDRIDFRRAVPIARPPRD